MKKEAKNHCPHCHQSLNYILEIDKGTVEILKSVSDFIRRKGINAVHPRKEIEGLLLTSNQVGNLSRPRFHGLIAKIKGNSGNYCLTTKGLDFLRGQPIPRSAIIQKATEFNSAMNSGYDFSAGMVKITDFDKTWDEYWHANGYEISEGRVITKPPVKVQEKLSF